jgi:hypothetical protein
MKVLQINNRLKFALECVKIYFRKRIVHGYAKRLGVDILCAVKELRLIGIEISEERISLICQQDKHILFGFQSSRTF